MTPILLSVVIPSYRDPLLHPTIDSLLSQSGLGEKLEIVVSLDGYWPQQPIRDDPRVRVVHSGSNRGMRESINRAVAVSRGEYIMRTDEHAMFGDRYDLILTAQMQDDWIVTPRRYSLDPVGWAVMDIPPVDYMKLKIVNYDRGQKFSGVDWPRRAEERKDIAIDETMAMQGSCWIMKRTWWDSVIGELQSEGYGPHYQDSHEMSFLNWRAGGKLMVNKNTWHAHKHRSFPRSHNGGSPEHPSDPDGSFAYCLSVWRDYYQQEILPKWFPT